MVDLPEIKINVIKRDGSEVKFDSSKIINAITKANEATTGSTKITDELIISATKDVLSQISSFSHPINVEEIQDMVEIAIMRVGGYEVAQKYVRYRFSRELLRKGTDIDSKILSLVDGCNEESKVENANKNPILLSTQRDYMAGEVSKDISRRLLIPEDIVKAHDAGIIHQHDLDYYAMREHNCELVNLEDILQNGTVITGTKIEKPHSFLTACNIATQVVAQVASNSKGGQTFSLAHLAPFVEVSRQKIRNEVRKERYLCGEVLDDNIINKVTEMRLKDVIKAGIQTIQYQLITLMTTNGQTPFVTMFIYLDEVPEGQMRDDLVMIATEVLRQRIEGVKNEKGVWITPAFPKIVVVLDEDNIHPDSKYYDFIKLSAQCSAKRMTPDYISAKIMKELKGDIYPNMGCRAFLTPDIEGLGPNGEHKYYGRFNQEVVTLNLVDVACSSYGDMDKFWEILEERLELCHKALRVQHERLLGTPSDVAPIIWQHGVVARLKKGEKIDKLLYNNYSTISLGYVGVWEMCMRMLGVSQFEPEGREFAIKVMQKLNDKCAEWRANENISYSVYGTPIESTTYKFAKCLQKRFGIIPGVTDKNYITNSFHYHVTCDVDAFTKIKNEAEFQRLSPGGSIIYCEVPNLQNNIDAVLELMRFIYDNALYAELNTKSDYCSACGYDGEIKVIKDENGKYIWECPNCGNRDQSSMSVARRTCGLTTLYRPR